MIILHATRIIAIVSIFEYFSCGKPEDNGIILGLGNPTALASIADPSRTIVEDLDYTYHYSALNPPRGKIYSIASDPEKQTIFAAVDHIIYIYPNFTIWQNTSLSLKIAYNGKSSSYGHIAFDYTSDNLYWCDSFYNWIAMKPAYVYNNTIYKVVVDTDLYKPAGLALDPEDRLMFFSDNGPRARIEKASMDGENRSTIIYKSLIRVLAVTVDDVSDLLYWADYGRHTLEVSDYDGRNRRVIQRMYESTFSDLHFYQNTLHVLTAERRGIQGINTTTGTVVYNQDFSQHQPFAIHAYDSEWSRSYTDLCSSRDCQQICVNTLEGAKCLCGEGYILSSDGRSCTDRTWFHDRGFIIINATHIGMMEAQFRNGGHELYPYYVINNIQTFAVDANLHLIYYVDGSSELREINLIRSKISPITSVAAVVTDMVFDWIADLLGWIEPTYSKIQAYSINSKMNSVIYFDLENPTSLTVDAHNGDLYWISGTSRKVIMKGNWSKKPPIIIVSSDKLVQPKSLRYDVTSHRIYWLDDLRIRSSMTNGSDIQRHVLTNGATQIFIYKEYLGWINGSKTYLARKSAVSFHSELSIMHNAEQIVVFDPSLQQDRRSSCQILNGGCDDICVPIESGQKCECDIGLQLKDNLTCISSIYSENFILVSDNSHGRILQIDINIGNTVKLPLGIPDLRGITFDKSTKELFYSESFTNTIMSTSLNGENTSLIYSTGPAYANRFAIDYSTGNIYYTAQILTHGRSYIAVIHRKSLYQKTLIENLSIPGDIVLYPSKGFMFWINNKTEISRSLMDGTFRMSIARTNISEAIGLTIDFATNTLFWTDGLKNTIEYSDLNGHYRRDLIEVTGAHLMDIFVHGKYLYYTAWNRQTITKLDKTDPQKHIIFMSNHSELGRLESLVVYADDIVDVNAMCSKKNGNCSTFCLPTPRGRTCGCQDNVNLEADQTTCQGVQRCNMSSQRVNVIDCLAFPGETCEFECRTGFIRAVNATLTCDMFGQWNPPLTHLCAEACSKTIQNGQLINCQSNFGETCQYECNAPLEINPYFPNITCNTSGNWSHDTNSLCVQLCTSTIIHGNLESDCQRTIGSNCSYTCDSGYHPSISSQQLFCGSDGTWNKDIYGLCKRTTCPTSIQNGRVINCQSYPGHTCTYQCNSPFEINPSAPTVTCNANGQWNHDITDLCVRLCPSKIQNGNLGPGCQRKIGHKCSYTCDIDFRASISSENIVCTSDFNWNENVEELCKWRDCTKSIQNGHLINCESKAGDTCLYQCDNPFEVNPSVQNITCNTTEEWSHDTNDLCVKLCPSTIPNGNLGPSCQRKGGSKCSYTCDLGYQSSISSDYIICTSDFTWHENIKDLCKLISCPLEIPNGNLSSKCHGNIGDKCEIICHEGFITQPLNDYLVCTSSGSWDKDIHAVCMRRTDFRCPKTIPQGHLMQCQSNIGEICRYQCDSPFEVNPSAPNVTCNASGEWSHDTTDLCVRLCPKTIQNGNLALGCQRHIGSSCSFTCVTGYVSSISTPNIFCTSDSTWNENTKELCKQMRCPLEIPNGNLSLLCQGSIGEKCKVDCHGQLKTNSKHLFCTSSGAWDKNTDLICAQTNYQGASKEDKTGLYAAVSIAVVIMCVNVSVVTVCCIRRKRRPSRNLSQMELHNESSSYGSVRDARVRS